MASSSDNSVTDSIREDFLTCNICFEVFTDPRILPCLHSYCFKCIGTHVDTAKADGRPVACPECREPISEAVGPLKANFFINGLAEVVKEKSAKTINCTACHLNGKSSKAKVKCLDCGDYLCSTCSDGHNASSLTWKHEKISLDDIKQGTYDEKLRQLQKIKCLQHEDKDVEFYCESCSKSVCLTCVLLEHRGDHKCKTISEAVCDKKSVIISLTEKLREHLTLFKHEETTVKSKLEALQKAERTEKMEIETKARQDIAKINSSKKIALEKNANKTKAAQKEYNGQLQLVKLQKRLVSNCVNFSDDILKKGKDEEVLHLEAMVTERIMCLQKLHSGVLLEDRGQTLSELKSELNVQPDYPQTASVTNKQQTEANSDGASNGVKNDMNNDILQGRDEATGQKQDKKNTSIPPKKTEVKIKLQVKFSVKNPKDMKNPDIKDMVYSSTIGLIIVDRGNNKIKVLDKAGGLKREITSYEFYPFSVAVIGDIIGAISVNYLYMFNSTGTLKKRVKVTDQKPNQGFHFTYSLAASENYGFVVGNLWGNSRLSFYSQEGILTKTLNCSLALPLAALSISSSGDLVLSEWGSGRLRVISPEGKLRFSVTEAGWKPNGTCTSKDGSVFVAEYHYQSVGVYSQNGDHLLDFKTASDGVRNPVSVAVDEYDKLYVTGNSGNVCVYEVFKREK